MVKYEVVLLSHVTSNSIAEQPEARERMVHVVKWYLSAFHAGRKGSVAKKPYNPILGEVFYCHWDLASDTEEPSPLTVRPHASAALAGSRLFVDNLNKLLCWE